jgi:hypothetical protein
MAVVKMHTRPAVRLKIGFRSVGLVGRSGLWLLRPRAYFNHTNGNGPWAPKTHRRMQIIYPVHTIRSIHTAGGIPLPKSP